MSRALPILFCDFSAGGDIEDALRAMVALSDRIQAGLESEINGQRVLVSPGDNADTLVFNWEARHHDTPRYVTAAPGRKDS